jgi:pyruvate dehydrogenase E1 component alpha subunit
MTEAYLDKAALLPLFERMLLIRRAEESLRDAFARGNLPGAVHLCIGQEAVAVGVCSQLDQGDWIASTHRGHGHFLAKGGDLGAMFAEIAGKASGVCKGMGGSLHVTDVSKGMLGANGIVGGGLPIATGSALAAQLDGNGAAAVCFFGDGAASQGVLMECLNVSALWRLPIIFVCENNGIAEFMASDSINAGKIVDRAKAFGMPSTALDGNDVLAVVDATRLAVARCRLNEGPSFIEALTYRVRSHCEGLEFMGGIEWHTGKLQEWTSPQRDPISRLRSVLIENCLCTDADLEGIEAEVRAQVERAAAFAEASAPSDSGLPLRLAALAGE